MGLAQASLLGGCSTLSRDGPSAENIEGRAAAVAPAVNDRPVFNYALLDITEETVRIFGKPPASSLYSTYGRDRGPPAEIRVGVGDVVQVTVFESQAGGLFIPGEAGVRPGNFVTMPQEIVDQRGTLTIPYAGQIPVVGRTIPEVESSIVKALSNRAIEPQAVLTMVSRASTQATVVGAVNTPSKIEVGPKGERVLDMIAKANGINAPGYEIYITVERGNRKATVYFDTILANPKENIYIHPGDTIYAVRVPHRFVAFGAVKVSGHIDFGQPSLTLVEAVARASGLDDARADPNDTFLYRQSPRALLEEANVDLQYFPPDQKMIPVIFRANFRDSASYFAATQFKLADKDVIYVSNSASYELYKFLDLLNHTSSTVANVPYNIATARSAGASLGRKALPVVSTSP